MSPSSKIIIGKIIKQQRLKSGLTLDELALKLKTDRQYIWKIENGKVNMSLNYLDKIITTLKVEHNSIFNIK